MKKHIYYFLLFILSFFILKIPSFAEEEILIIFDASSSMLYKVNNEPKYIQTIKVLKKVLSQTDNSKKIGLRVIGVSVDSNLLSYVISPEKMCKSTKILSPIKSNNINNIISNLDSIILPLGLSPITYSLSMAIDNDFSTNANPKHIILVTDGEEGCDKDPCEYIKEISSIRNDIKIDVIAISVNSNNDFMQLKCLAEYTGGKIKSANNTDEINIAFHSFLPKLSSFYNIPNDNLTKRNIINYKNYLLETDK